MVSASSYYTTTERPSLTTSLTASPEPTAWPGQFDAQAAQGLVGEMFGLPVYTDANIPTNLGAGTNQAPIFVGKFDDYYLYEGAPRMRVMPEVLSGVLAVRLQVWNYAAFIPNRYSVSTSIINGTGCVTQAGY